MAHLEQLCLSVFLSESVWNCFLELITVTFSISVHWILIILVLLTFVVDTASQNTRRREKCISVILAIMRIYKTCNSVVMGTFSIYNLLKYFIIMMCVCVCLCTYLCRVTNICIYNKSYFRAWDLIMLVEELDTAPVKLDKGIWNAVGTHRPHT